MRLIGSTILLFLITACSGNDNGGAAAEEPPFFQAGRFTRGPLTLEELEINLPDDVESMITEEQKTCFFAAVERRAGEAGDPADIDPDDFDYWRGEVSREDWDKQSNHMKRVLLAQAIVSWAMIDCT